MVGDPSRDVRDGETERLLQKTWNKKRDERNGKQCMYTKGSWGMCGPRLVYR